jgi:hypothetical protein
VLGAVLVAFGLLLGGCSAPQDPADLPFRTSSILRHDNGRMQRALLVAETEVEGFACQRWVWWYAHGALDNIELARASVVQGHAFPAGTRVFFDCRRPRRSRVVVGGRAHRRTPVPRPLEDRHGLPSERAREGLLPAVRSRDRRRHVQRERVPRGVLASRRPLRQCKLARPATLDGRDFEQGVVLTLDELGPTDRRALSVAPS